MQATLHAVTAALGGLEKCRFRSRVWGLGFRVQGLGFRVLARTLSPKQPSNPKFLNPLLLIYINQKR